MAIGHIFFFICIQTLLTRFLLKLTRLKNHNKIWTNIYILLLVSKVDHSSFGFLLLSTLCVPSTNNSTTTQPTTPSTSGASATDVQNNSTEVDTRNTTLPSVNEGILHVRYPMKFNHCSSTYHKNCKNSYLAYYICRIYLLF